MDPAFIEDLMRKQKAAIEAEKLKDANRPRIEIPRPTPPKPEPKKDAIHIQVL